MKEKDLRKYHRITGVVLAIFIIVQAGTGLFFTIGKMLGSSGDHEHGHAALSMSLIADVQANTNNSVATQTQEESESLLSTLHYGGGMIGNIYRLLLALGIIGQVCGGLYIYKRHRQRMAAKE